MVPCQPRPQPGSTFESLEGQLPFWFGPSLSLTTVAYALGLTALGALVAGVLPGLKITEGNLESRLRQSSAGLPSTGVSRLWSGIIVVQVAMSALAVPIAYTVFTQMLEKRGTVVPGGTDPNTSRSPDASKLLSNANGHRASRRVGRQPR